MNNNKYPLFGLVLVAGAAVAIWAGLPPFYLVFLVLCPLMMFAMMRGMGGMHGDHDQSGAAEAKTPGNAGDNKQPDGAHEHTNRP